MIEATVVYESAYKFQSHHGLILTTIMKLAVTAALGYFNPTMV